MKGRGYSFDTLRARSLYRKNNLQSIMDSGGLSIGPNVLSKDPLFTTETPDEELQEAEAQDAPAESELVVDEATGEILNQ
jgi:transposase